MMAKKDLLITPKELVKKSLGFQSPARIPRQLWVLPWAEKHYPAQLQKIRQTFRDDIVFCPSFLKEEPLVRGDIYALGEYTDEWGCQFVNLQEGIIGEVKDPLVHEWAEIDKVRIPTEHLQVEVGKINAYCQNRDQFIIAGLDPGSLPRPFERLQFIRGTTNLYMDLMDQPEGLFILLDQIHQFYKRVLKTWVSTDVDAIWFMDDWGSQRSMLVSPKLWRQIFKPLYKDYIDIAHEHGKFAFMHSDGCILDILPDLIDLGLDAINAQIFCIGLDNLEPFRGQITFWGEIDRQHMLATGTPDEVAKAVKLVVKTLYQEGGVIAQCEFGPGASPENVYAVFDAWNRIGRSLQET